MPAPGEQKTVQARILKYAQEIGWTYVPRAEAEAWATAPILDAAGILSKAVRELCGGLPGHLGKQAQEGV
jgi:hypothetical protein